MQALFSPSSTLATPGVHHQAVSQGQAQQPKISIIIPKKPTTMRLAREWKNRGAIDGECLQPSPLPLRVVFTRAPQLRACQALSHASAPDGLWSPFQKS